MTEITVKVTVQGTDGLAKEYLCKTQLDENCTESGVDSFASELFEYVDAELNWQRYTDELRPLESLVSGSQDASLDAGRPAAFSDVMNRQELWREIQNTLYDVVHGLALAKAYRSIEPKGTPQQWFSAHSRKLSNLNMAALYLAKVQDLVVRLLFESFGGDEFIRVDVSDDDWERALVMKKAKEALSRLLAESKLTESEFQEITDAIQEPTRCANQTLVVRYRNCVAHRVRPSVDHWETSPVFQSREGKVITGENGDSIGIRWAIGVQPNKPQYEFEELYEAMKEYLHHVYVMLTKLKAIPKLA